MIVEAPAAAFDAAVKVMVWAVPGVRASVEGLAVTPVGKPVNDTLTVPVKPLSAVAIIASCWPDAPAVSVSVEGEAVRLKSGGVVTLLDD